MFTSLRSRLWLNYAFVITIALSIVAIVMLVFLIRNPFASREIQQRLRTAQDLIMATPQKFIDNPNSLEEITQAYNVRTLVFNSARQLVFNSNSEHSSHFLSPQKFVGAKCTNCQRCKWRSLALHLQTLVRGSYPGCRCPAPRLPVLNIFTDQLLLPIVRVD